MRNPEGTNRAQSEDEVIIPYEARPSAMWSWERTGYFTNALSKFRRRMSADFYAPPPEHQGSYHFLNSASLPNPEPRVRSAAQAVYDRWQSGQLTENEKEMLTSQSRQEIATLVNAPNPEHVVLCRNTTEAFSLFLWLSGVLDNLSVNNWSMVLSTDVENPSIERGIFIIKDHSNTDREDNISTWPHFASQRQRSYQPIKPRATGLRWGYFQTSRNSDDEAIQHMESFLTNESHISVLVLSHVSRETGRRLPVEEMIRHARNINPNLFIVVDGAQAVGNIPVDVQSLDCDMYIGGGHKALQGEAVGYAVLNPNSPRIGRGLEKMKTVKPTDQAILRGMFDPALGIKPNVEDDVSYPELAGFLHNMQILQAEGWISGNDVSRLDSHRANLKQHCIAGLRVIAYDLGIDINLLDQVNGTNFILAFRIGKDPYLAQGGYDPHLGPEGIFEPGAMHDEPMPTESEGKHIAEELHHREVGIAFLRRSNTFRVSFSKNNTLSDINAFLNTFRNILQNR